MTQFKPKIILKAKCDEAYISVKQLMVTLKWSASVDLDLMAFYKTKDGQVGGVFSENYAGGSMGSSNTFPFIQLSGDAGVGSRGGPNNEEVLRITKLDHIEELYICAINFTDASQNRNVTFSQYDGHVIVNDEKGKSISVPLDSNQPGTVAVIARIDNTGFMGAKLINENRLMDMPTFQATIPGASLLKLSSKVFLKQKGDTVKLKPKGGGLGEIAVNLNWSQRRGQAQQRGFIRRVLAGGGNGGIDLDLGCLFELTTEQKGVVQALGNAFGSYDHPPYVMLSGDDRTGAWAQGENLRINGEHIRQIRRALVYAFIYEGIRNWSQANAVVTIKQSGAPDIVIELDEHHDGKIMCAIALFDNIGNTFSVQRLVQYFDGHSDMDQAFGWGLRWVQGTKD